MALKGTIIIATLIDGLDEKRVLGSSQLCWDSKNHVYLDVNAA